MKKTPQKLSRKKAFHLVSYPPELKTCWSLAFTCGEDEPKLSLTQKKQNSPEIVLKPDYWISTTALK